MKRPFKFICVTLLLLLMVTTRGVNAQQSTSAAPASSQNGCSQIVVIGAVRTPRRLAADHGIGILEVLRLVGGPNERAGKIVRMIRPCNCSPCDKPGENKTTEYYLADVLRDRGNASPDLAPGDIMVVPEADPVFVIGTARTASIRFVEGMTVTRAIALAGGPVKSSEVVTVRVYRHSSNTPRIVIYPINLKATIEGRATDLQLQPLDIVEVSDGLGHFPVPRMSPPTWDPPLPKWNPPLHPPKGPSGSTFITGAFLRNSTCCIDSARL